jgi:hypothetical protein
MGANRTTFEKLQRDRAKKAKAAAKRERRAGGAEPRTSDDAVASPGADEWSVADSEEPLSAAQLLELVEQLHQQYESKSITFDEFEERKIDLLARISVD